MLYLLRAFGHECDAATGGTDAIAKARERRYDLAVVDILMPGTDGYEVARRLKSEPATAELPLIAVTALATSGDRERVVKAGFTGYIPKPIEPQRFVQQIEAYLGAAAQAGRPADGPVVLAVDDLQVNLDVVRASLMPFGYQVVEARSVEEALALMARARPDAVLCDLHMPREGGFALIEALHANEAWRAIPFAFLSSTAWQTKDRRRGIELGAKKFVLRPIEPQKLREEVEALIADGKSTDR